MPLLGPRRESFDPWKTFVPWAARPPHTLAIQQPPFRSHPESHISKTIDLLWCWARILDSRSCSGTRCDAGLLCRSSGILAHWRAVVLGRAVICSCLDVALGNCRHRIVWTWQIRRVLDTAFSFCPTRFSRKRAGAPPPDSTFTPDSHQPSAVPGAAKYIYSLPHVTSRLYVGVFLGIQCARLNFLLYVVLILYRLITYPIGSLANADIRVWRLRPIHFPHVHHLSYRHA